MKNKKQINESATTELQVTSGPSSIERNYSGGSRNDVIIISCLFIKTITLSRDKQAIH